MMQVPTKLLLFFFITYAGSALSSIATFLSIEQYFGKLTYLGLALSLRTAVVFVFSYKAGAIIECLGTKAAFFVSQAVGLLALTVLGFGIFLVNLPLTLTGVMLAGIPTTFVVILMTSTLRIATDTDDDFRKFSGAREMISGAAMLSAAILAPLLLLKFSILIVLTIDAVTYIVGLIILVFLKIEDERTDSFAAKPKSQWEVFKNENTWKYIWSTGGALILAGLVPLFASSGQIEISAILPPLFREWMWGIEGAMVLSASSMYVWIRSALDVRPFKLLLSLNALSLLAIGLLPTPVTVVLGTLFISLSNSLAFQKFRDDYVISAGRSPDDIRAFTSMSLVQKNVVLAVSPLLLSGLLSRFSLIQSALILVVYQVSFVLLSLFRPR